MLALANAVAEDEAVNRTAFPPGSTWGQRWVISPRPSVVIACHAPPLAEMCARGSVVPRSATMLPSSPQLAPGILLMDVPKVTGDPPCADIFLIWVGVRNPIV